MEIIEYQAPSDMLQFFKLIKLLYPKMSKKEYVLKIKEMVDKQNYKMVVVFDGKKPIALCGYMIGTMLYCGRYLQLMNLIVEPKYRQKSIASQITEYLYKKAKEESCEKIVLDSYVTNHPSHRMYFKDGFHILGYHFAKDLK